MLDIWQTKKLIGTGLLPISLSTLSLGFPLSVELATLSYTKTRSFLACFRCVDGSAVIGPLQKRKPPESRLLIKIEALSSRRTVGVSLYPLLAGPQTFSEYDSSFETANCTLFRFPFRRLPLIFVYLANRRPPFRCTPGEWFLHQFLQFSVISKFGPSPLLLKPLH